MNYKCKLNVRVNYYLNNMIYLCFLGQLYEFKVSLYGCVYIGCNLVNSHNNNSSLGSN